MRVLVVGAGGMLGHQVWRACRDRFETWVTLHDAARSYARGQLFEPSRTIERLDVRDADAVVRAVATVKPAAIVNCVGIIKQRAEGKDPIVNLTVNALFPHRLAALATAAGARLIHISTDCVFSGTRGGYVEDDRPDADDLYGRTKFLGEVGAPHLTLRTSLIGRELRGQDGLVEWFLGRRGGRADGYTGAVFSGFTTRQMARIVVDVIEGQPRLAGVYHVAAESITKYALLELLNDAFDAGVTLDAVAEPRIDRSLNGSRFRDATGLTAPPWLAMIADLASDPAPYEEWRHA